MIRAIIKSYFVLTLIQIRRYAKRKRCVAELASARYVDFVEVDITAFYAR